MDWLQFVSSLISALAWPAAVTGIVFMLKGPILGIIPKIRTLKYGDLHVDLTEQLKTLQDDLPVAAPDPLAPPEAVSTAPSIPIQLAALSPRAGVIAAWLEVEKALNQSIERNQFMLSTHGKIHVLSPREKWKVLRDNNVIDTHTFNIGTKASQLRNEAIHMLDREVTFEDAVAMASICEWLEQRLNEMESYADPVDRDQPPA